MAKPGLRHSQNGDRHPQSSLAVPAEEQTASIVGAVGSGYREAEGRVAARGLGILESTEDGGYF
jgi:hypothetical protein